MKDLIFSKVKVGTDITSFLPDVLGIEPEMYWQTIYKFAASSFKASFLS